MTLCAVTDCRVTEQAIGMAYAVVLAAVVPFAVAALSYRFVEISLLLFSRSNSLRTIIIQTATALADTWHTGQPLLEAYAVKLATMTAFAVATFASRWLSPDLVELLTHRFGKAMRTTLLINTPFRFFSPCLLVYYSCSALLGTKLRGRYHLRSQVVQRSRRWVHLTCTSALLGATCISAT